jgi:hypothetical protein
VVGAASLFLGFPLGLLWWLVAPLARIEKRADGVFAAGLQTETAVAADGWFAVCAICAGAIVAVATAFLLRRQRLGALAGLATGGVLGSVVAWRLGVLLGPSSIEASATAARNGARFDGPLDLSALGVLLAWSMAAVVVFFAAVAGLDAGLAEDTMSVGTDGASGDVPPEGLQDRS